MKYVVRKATLKRVIRFLEPFGLKPLILDAEPNLMRYSVQISYPMAVAIKLALSSFSRRIF
jgi:hypothetical protein